MRTKSLLGIVLALAATAACTSTERRPGVAAPAGSPAPIGSGTASAVPSAALAEPTARATPSAPVGATTGASRGGEQSEIRKTDWPNVAVKGLTFCGEADDVVRFRDGSNGLDIPCRMLPGGARPVYGEFLVEEPANAPARGDALVLVELGNPDAARQQALVPIQIGFDGKTREAWPVIKGDPSSAAGDKVMTFTSYRIERQTVVTTVKRLDGKTETRRYRLAGMHGPWERF
ncbi:hypothetical protein GCM10022225_79220 [Plantactinospora mayteni]|uniref:Lipoprotein n=1 Tax=Plantactinospora mayteni TaxID=566021 RepID=A0ABQ4F2T6_9ACTN|nr:hypothetical protein [Plantactinospora mayteni]GIH01228.1 hypothetical protein Pma05_78000 [Plantactinospora mayteni]